MFVNQQGDGNKCLLIMHHVTTTSIQTKQGSHITLYGFIINNKVLLREGKRHTARRVASTPSAVLSGGGYPSPGQEGVPPRKDLGPDTWERTWDWGTPGKDQGPETWERNLELGYPSPTPVYGHTLVKTLLSHIPLEMRAGNKVSSPSASRYQCLC